MKVSCLCIGKHKNQSDLSTLDTYIKRLRPWAVTIHTGDHGTPSQECDWFVHRLKPNAYKIMLCEHGQQLTSVQLANLIQQQCIQGFSAFQVLIGGASGFAPDLSDYVDAKLSLSLLTWPHLMVRVMIMEQLYRAKTIMENHPYHK